ncbi:hypothetical protein [Rhodococcus sp. 077-4]|uniref:hypothetical protein n=1 Tax=Rhodococcus sp. 077-4 TaxID=2789271 RepID=UPI0039F5D7C6
MTAILLQRPAGHSAQSPSSLDVLAVAGVVYPGDIALVGAAVGLVGVDQPCLTAMLTAGMDSSPPGARLLDVPRSAEFADGLFLVLDCDVDTVGSDALRSQIESICGGGDLAGRPVGAAVVGSDCFRCSRVLESMRSIVVDAHGLPVGVGVVVDATDGVASSTAGAGRPVLFDVTVASQLALLGRRVSTLAAARRSLRRRR